MRQLSGVDASFLYFETPTSPGHVFSLHVYQQPSSGAKVTFASILEHVRSRMHVSPVFRQRVVRVPLGLDHPYWVNDPAFDLENHVRRVTLPDPGDWAQLCAQVGDLHSRPLDQRRPLWELYVLDGLDDVEGLPPGSFAVMTKIHHTAADGISLIEIASAIHDTSPDPDASDQVDEWRPERVPEPMSLLARAAVNGMTRPARMARRAAALVPGTSARFGGQSSAGGIDIPEISPAPRTRFSGTVTGERVVEARTFDFATARAIKTAVPGATINDVAITVVGGAMRRYLSELDELPRDGLRVMAPISTRSSTQSGTAGNQVTAMLTTSGSDIEDPLARLAMVHESTVASKALTDATSAADLAEFSEMLPGGLAMLSARTAAQFQMATRATPIINTVISNVPGPRVPLYLGGAPMVKFFAAAGVGDGMGLLHASAAISTI